MTTRLTRTTVAAICAMVVLIAGGTTAAIATTTAAPTTVTITGTISDPGGYPLAGIKIELFKDGADEGTYVGTATTNDAGRYRFTGVQAEAGDPFWFGATDSSGAHVYAYSGFNVGSGTVTTKNRTMSIAGFIQGKVSTKDGTAAAQLGKHVYVTAYGTDTVASAHVSAKGKFRIGGLPAGSYVLELIDGDDLFAAQCYNNVKMSKEGCEGTKSATHIKVIAGKAVTIAPQVMNRPINR
jgi:hypothetical protein